MKKEVKRLGKNEEEITKTIHYRLKFIDSARFMVCSLTNLVNNLLKEFIKLNGNMETKIKTVKRAELNIKIASAASNTHKLKMI